MVGCHDQLNGDEFGLTLGDGGANSGSNLLFYFVLFLKNTLFSIGV